MSLRHPFQLHGYFDNGVLVTTSPYARYPLRCRPHSSDPQVYYQVFLQRQYGCVDDLTDVGLILDCGANVGYSAAYFLTQFPNSFLIAVEPDPDNYQLLCENLAPYGQSVQPLHMAVWSHPVPLTMAEIPYRDGREWARQVRPCQVGELPSFMATDVAGLLAQSGYERISILKMDVEGAEAIIFADQVDAWLDRVDNLVIELHNDSMFGNATAVFLRAIAGRGFSITCHHELTVCRRQMPT